MGNKASKQDQGPAVAQYHPTYEVIRPIDDPNYGKVKLIRDTKSNRQMILKEFVFDTKEKYEEELKFFKARAAHEHPSIVHFIGYNAKDSSNLCSTFYKVSVFLEILITDLQSDFRERIRTLHNYTENDVLLVAENISSALAYMQSHNLSHGDVRPLNIFVSGDGKSYKLTDPKLEADRSSNGLVKAIFQSAHPLLAPELASLVPTGEFSHSANPYHTDIFSLGATLLQLATMKSSEDLYDYKKGTISQRLLDERLRQVQQNYSQLTFTLIRDMLSIQPNQRPTAAQIQNAVAPYKQDIIVNQNQHKLEKHASFGPIDSTPKNELVKRSGFPLQLASLKNRNLEEDSYLQGARSDRSNPTGFPRNLGEFDHQYQSARSHNPHNHDAGLFKVREPSNTEHLELEPSVASPEFTSDLDRKVFAALQRTQKTYTQVQSITSKAGSDKKKTVDSNIPPVRNTEQIASSKYGSSYLAYQPSGNLYITIEPPPVDIRNTQNPFRSDLQRPEERAKRSAIPDVIPEISEVHSQFEGTTFTNEYVIPRTGYYVAEFQNPEPAAPLSYKNGETEREPYMLPPHPQEFSPHGQYQAVEYTSVIPEIHNVDPEINEVVAQIIAEQREYELRSSQVDGQRLLDSTVRSFQKPATDSFHAPATDSFQAPATDSFHYAYDSNYQSQPQPQTFQYQTVPVQDLHRDISYSNSNFETRPENTGEKIKRSALASASKKYNQPETISSHRSYDIPVISYNIGGAQGLNYSPEQNSRDVIVNEGRNTAQGYSSGNYSFHQKYSTAAEPQTRATTTGYPTQETKNIGPFGGTIVYETHGRRPQDFSSGYEFGRGGLLADVSSASSKYTTTSLGGHGRFEESGDLRKFV